MFLGIVRYALDNGVAGIRSDLAEYKRLGKKCRSLKNLKNNRYNLLRDEKGCIDRSIKTETVSVGADNNTDFELFEYDCENFTPCAKFTQNLCTDTTCPFYENNKKYAEACERYAAAVKSRKAFWSKKFARSK